MEDEDDTNGSEEHFFTRTRLISFIFTWASGNRSSSYVNGLTHEFIILLCEEILIRKARRGVSLFLAPDLKILISPIFTQSFNLKCVTNELVANN